MRLHAFMWIASYMAWHDNCMNSKEWHAMTSIGKPFTIPKIRDLGSKQV